MTIIKNLRPGTGVVLRNYSAPDRADWARRLVNLCRQRRLIVLIAGDDRLALACRTDGVHWPEHMARRRRRRVKRGLLLTATAHDPAGIAAAKRLGTDGLFLSPVFATQSHPGGRFLGATRFGLLLRGVDTPVIALGGMNGTTFRQVRSRKIHGLAAIAAWQA